MFGRGADEYGCFHKDIKHGGSFIHGFQDIYYAEQRITKAMIDMATNRDLSADCALIWRKQIERLDRVFVKLGQKPKGTNSPAIDGILKEGDEIAGEVADKSVLDAAIVASCQAVEHFELTAVRDADRLG